MKFACGMCEVLLKIILGTWEIVKFNSPNTFIFQIINIFSNQIFCLYGNKASFNAKINSTIPRSRLYYINIQGEVTSKAKLKTRLESSVMLV